MSLGAWGPRRDDWVRDVVACAALARASGGQAQGAGRDRGAASPFADLEKSQTFAHSHALPGTLIIRLPGVTWRSAGRIEEETRLVSWPGTSLPI